MAAVNVTFPGNLAQVKTANDLRSVPSTLLPLGALFLVNGLEGLFEYDPGSAAPDDGRDVLRPFDKTPGQVGRWLRNVDGLATGPEGPTGPANSTYTTLAALKAAAVSNASYIFAPPSGSDGGAAPGTFLYQTAGAPYTADGVNVIKLDAVPLTTGALVRQGAEGIAFTPSGTTPRTRTTQDKARERRTILDKAGGVPDGTTSNRAALLALIADGGGIIPAGTYVLDAPVNLPAGTILTHEGSPTIIYTGAAATGNSGILIFGGDGVKIRPVDNSVLTVRAVNGNGFLWACYGLSVNDFEVGNVQGDNCNHWFGTSSAGAIYTNVNSANMCKRGKIYGGGARFDAISSQGSEGACYLGYSDGVTVDGSTYENTAQGVQWWGGDSNPGGDGAYANERKTRNLDVRNVLVANVALGGIWGSMGQGVRVRDSRVVGAGDVGLDAEGCFDTKFINCDASRCANGAASAFFINENVEFIGGTLESDNEAKPLFRNYNSAQNFEPRSIALRDITLIGRGPTPSTVDTANGPVRSITIENCRGTNARIAVVANNLNEVIIRDNRLSFDTRSSNAFNAIHVDGAKGFQAAGSASVTIARVVVTGNIIGGTRDQVMGTRNVYVRSDDGNYPVAVELSRNRMRLMTGAASFAATLVEHAGGNAGIVTTFRLRDNTTDGAMTTSTTGAAPGNFKGTGNENFAGADVPLTGV